MKKVYLLKPYKNHGSNEIITVSNDVAFSLIDKGIARTTTNRDFLVKTELGETKAINTKKVAGIKEIKRRQK